MTEFSVLCELYLKRYQCTWSNYYSVVQKIN